jgi:hypothetical protein
MAIQDIITGLNANMIDSMGIGRNTNADKKADQPDDLSRFIGGHRRTTQPFISGYWYFLINPPPAIFGTASNLQQAQKWFHSTAESFTPPSKMLTMADVPAMGGNASSFVSGAELTRTFSVAFREYQNTPIINALDSWTDSIMNPNVGVSGLKNYIPTQYKGSAFAFLVRPTLGDQGKNLVTSQDIEKLYFFDGVVPEGSPHDALAADISGHDSVQVSTTFRFDGWPLTEANPHALTKGLDALNDYVLKDFDITEGNVKAAGSGAA